MALLCAVEDRPPVQFGPRLDQKREVADPFQKTPPLFGPVTGQKHRHVVPGQCGYGMSGERHVLNFGPHFGKSKRKGTSKRGQFPMQIDVNAGVRVAVRILSRGLEVIALSLIVPFGSVAKGLQQLFGPGQVRLPDDHVDIDESPKREVAVDGFRQNRPLERSRADAVALKFGDYAQSLGRQNEVPPRVAACKALQFAAHVFGDGLPAGGPETAEQQRHDAMPAADADAHPEAAPDLTRRRDSYKIPSTQFRRVSAREITWPSRNSRTSSGFSPVLSNTRASCTTRKTRRAFTRLRT